MSRAAQLSRLGSSSVLKDEVYSNPTWLTSLSYNKLIDKPILVAVATSGSYTDLSNKPTIPVVGTNALAYNSNLQSFVNTFDLPISDGIANQVLKTDGAGNLSFVTPTAEANLTSSDVITALGYTPQNTLVSGTNIKAINNISLLGSGNINVNGFLNNSHLLSIAPDGQIILPAAASFLNSTITLTTINPNQVVDTYIASIYKTVKYLIQATYNSNVHSSEVIIVNNGATVNISEYGIVYTASPLFTVSAAFNGINIELTMTPTNSNVIVDFVRTSLSIGTINTIPGSSAGDLTLLTGIEDLQSGN